MALVVCLFLSFASSQRRALCVHWKMSFSLGPIGSLRCRRPARKKKKKAASITKIEIKRMEDGPKKRLPSSCLTPFFTPLGYTHKGDVYRGRLGRRRKERIEKKKATEEGRKRGRKRSLLRKRRSKNWWINWNKSRENFSCSRRSPRRQPAHSTVPTHRKEIPSNTHRESGGKR